MTPTSFLQHTLAAIDSSDSAIFVALDRSGATAAASESTARYAAGAPLSLLDGVPIGVKCCVPVRGLVTTVGSRIFANLQPEECDAESVSRLRSAGALIAGHTGMHEVGIGGTGHNEYAGTVRNPHDPTRVAGGSSSGAAAAVASGLVPLCVSTCGGGSARIPAGFSGCVGLKAGFGIVPTRARCAAAVYHEGAMTLTVEDARAMLEVMSGHRIPRRLLGGRGRKPVRVGIFPALANDCDIFYYRAYQHALERLQQHANAIVEVAIPNLHIASTSLIISILSEIRLGLLDRQNAIAELCDPSTQMSLFLAGGVTADMALSAMVCRRFFVERVVPQLFAACDVLLTPQSGCLPPKVAPSKVDVSQTSEIIRFLFFANLTGIPALTVTTGKAVVSEGSPMLPTAVHLSANFCSEPLLLDVARALEPAVPVYPPQSVRRFHEKMVFTQ